MLKMFISPQVLNGYYVGVEAEDCMDGVALGSDGKERLSSYCLYTLTEL